MKKKWFTQINKKEYEIIEASDSLTGERVWIKFEPIDKSQPIEVGNILDRPDKVSWKFKNSHFEIIDKSGKSNYYPATSAGSIPLAAGTTVLAKDSSSKVLVFPLESGVTMNVQDNTLNGDQFAIVVNKDTWVGYVSTGGSINPL